MLERVVYCQEDEVTSVEESVEASVDLQAERIGSRTPPGTPGESPRSLIHRPVPPAPRALLTTMHPEGLRHRTGERGRRSIPPGQRAQILMMGAMPVT